MRWRRMAIGMAVAVAGIHAAAAQGVSIEARTELVTVEPYVERLVLTARNTGSTPAGIRISGVRYPWPTEQPPFPILFRCVNLAPIENNLCVVDNPCRAEDFLPPAPICGRFTMAPASELRCAWRVSQRTPGCAGELLRLAGSSSNTSQQVIVPLLTQMKGVQTLASGQLIMLAGALALAGWFMLMRRRRRHIISP